MMLAQPEPAPKLPSLVLIGGWGQPVHYIRPVLPATVTSVQSWSLYDFPEACREATPRQWLMSCMERAPERAVWVGWSLGGQLAMQAAQDYPQRVAGVITLCTTPRFVAGGDWSGGRPPAELEEFQHRCQQAPAATLRRFSLLQSQGDDFEREARRQGPASSDATAPSAALLGQTLQWLRYSDERSLWQSETPVPRLHVFGEKDPLVDPETPVSLGLRKQQYAVIPGMAHWPFGPHLQRLHHIISQALSGWGGVKSYESSGAQ